LLRLQISRLGQKMKRRTFIKAMLAVPIIGVEMPAKAG